MATRPVTSTRNIALGFLEKELEEHKQQLSTQRRELDIRLKPLRDEKNEVVNEIKSAHSLLDGLQAKLKDFEDLDKRLNEQIKEEEKKFEDEFEGLMARITGLKAALTELGSVRQSVEVKKEKGVIELGSGGDEGLEDVVSRVTEGVSVNSMSEVSSGEVPSTVDVFAPPVDVATDAATSHTLSSSIGNGPCEKPAATTAISKTVSKEKIAVAKISPETGLSSSEHASQILSRILIPKLPSFEKRKGSNGTAKPQVERLKRRKPSFAEEVAVLMKPVPKTCPKPKKTPGSKTKGRGREPLAVLTNENPNSYAKQLGSRRKEHRSEDSDASWNEEGVSINASDSDSEDQSPNGRRQGCRSREIDCESDLTSELIGEFNELVGDGSGKFDRKRTSANGTEEKGSNKKSKHVSGRADMGQGVEDGKADYEYSNMDTSIDELFFEKPALNEMTNDEANPPDEYNSFEVPVEPANDISSAIAPKPGSTAKSKSAVEATHSSHPPTNMKTEMEDVAVNSPTPWEPGKSSDCLAPMSPTSSSPPLKLPGPQELDLASSPGVLESQNAQHDREGLSERKSSYNQLSPSKLSPQPPTGPRALRPCSALEESFPRPITGTPTGPRDQGSLLGVQDFDSPKGLQKGSQAHQGDRRDEEYSNMYGKQHACQPDPYDRHDYRGRDITWDILRYNPQLWAHLHSVRQLRGLVFYHGRYTLIRCIYGYPERKCHDAFETLRDLRMHMFTVHCIKTYVCLLCKSAYGRKCDLWGHCKKFHDGLMGKYWRGHSNHV
ncbi:hypothetical protein B0I73DRAFT_163528 [Yarrowia lipolytica]|uniref:C2H2-type domain-containing protein n=1 Tax=Yarrowia lipolytica TaxID=4952 RepID=A0A371CEH6_YARLL|nr:hypothetical protein B0I71DRAFT_170826 [Yarrowia lipolytica]RDW41080.1 hypothetical protein B0I73DRAFT_163528 [Yarrowia lipolytica]